MNRYELIEKNDKIILKDNEFFNNDSSWDSEYIWNNFNVVYNDNSIFPIMIIERKTEQPLISFGICKGDEIEFEKTPNDDINNPTFTYDCGWIDNITFSLLACKSKMNLKYDNID